LEQLERAFWSLKTPWETLVRWWILFETQVNAKRKTSPEICLESWQHYGQFNAQLRHFFVLFVFVSLMYGIKLRVYPILVTQTIFDFFLLQMLITSPQTKNVFVPGYR